MNKKCLIFLMLLLSASGAFAHRLNEYLEATTISLSRGKVMMELRLTPGVAVATTVLKGIDLDNDNLISAAEQSAYVTRLVKDISLTLDGRIAGLNAVSSLFPTVEAMQKGTGDIRIELEADLEQKNPSHQLQLKNQHYSAIAVYLVNCLLPADTGIRVTSQTRNADQSVYQLDFTMGGMHAATIASMEKSDNQAVIKTYFVHGIHHILTGYDHLLFLCALVLGAASLWDLIKIVTAFTIAHSITLTLATFGLAHLPEQAVEPIIAASIVFVAVQNVWWPKNANGNSRLAVAFFFGLFHGLGFAGGLLELMYAMPTSLIWLAILGFSLGVEAGNQLVLLPLYGTLRSLPTQRMPILRRYTSGVVAVAGMYYLCAYFW
jgi:hydrogenase/urease accessory protein HupE